MLLFLRVTDPALALVLFFFNDTATTEIYTLSLHDALPIWYVILRDVYGDVFTYAGLGSVAKHRSEEHTSELQSHLNLVCRLLLEKKQKYKQRSTGIKSMRYHSNSRAANPQAIVAQDSDLRN